MFFTWVQQFSKSIKKETFCLRLLGFGGHRRHVAHERTISVVRVWRRISIESKLLVNALVPQGCCKYTMHWWIIGSEMSLSYSWWLKMWQEFDWATFPTEAPGKRCLHCLLPVFGGHAFLGLRLQKFSICFDLHVVVSLLYFCVYRYVLPQKACASGPRAPLGVAAFKTACVTRAQTLRRPRGCCLSGWLYTVGERTEEKKWYQNAAALLLAASCKVLCTPG